ncbi:MAG: hypothetical protein R3F56_12150 [Planctomycetota bacterium]
METPARDFFAYLDRPLRGRTRIFVALLCVPLLLSFAFPLWKISMTAPQYPKGLYMDIWSYKLSGGNGGHDIEEINNLNHYIGMHKITRSELQDLEWMPAALGALALLCLRTALLGNVRTLIDMSMLAGYVALFAFARFVYVLYQFGHDLDPTAPMNIPPFQPVIVGTKRIANFTTHSLPQAGSVLVGVFVGGLWLVTLRGLWQGRRASRTA